MTRRLDTADTLTRVFSLYAAQAGVLLPAALIIFLPVAILRGLISTGGAGVLLLLLASAVSLIGNVWYQGVVVEAVEDMQDGRRDFSVGELFRSAAPVIGTLLVARAPRHHTRTSRRASSRRVSSSPPASSEA